MPSPRRPTPRRKDARPLVIAILGVVMLAATVGIIMRGQSRDDTIIQADIHNGMKQATATVKTKKKQTPKIDDTTSSSSRLSLPPCPQYCDDIKKPITFKMAAVPHTASTSTDHVFKAVDLAWHSPTMPYRERGWKCPPNTTTVVEYHRPSCEQQQQKNISCLLSHLQYTSKTHNNLHNVKLLADKPFTILRQSGLFVMSQYSMRQTWDRRFPEFNPNSTELANISIEEWVDKAWWRHNLFTKMLATETTQLIWVQGNVGREIMKEHPVLPSKNESDAENELGKESEWFKTALSNLKEMPFFGLHHRLTDTFELMGFRLCFPVFEKEHAYMKKKSRTMSKTLEEIVKRRFKLDTLLLEAAEPIFDEMVADMRRKKAQGVLCDLSFVLDDSNKSNEDSVGLQCK
jgi:hypothetical protein